MARRTFAILDRLVLNFGLRELLLKILMAVEAELPIRFGQELFDLRFVGLVTGRTLAVLNRLVFDLGSLELLVENVMAVKTQLTICFYQQPLLGGRVRIMAGKAFAILGRLMPALAFGHRRVMTVQAQSLAYFH